MFSRFKLHYWPSLMSGWFILTFTVSYLTAVLNGHVQEYFPFISDTGAEPPESCILGQMMNIAAVFMAITLYIRYRQIDFAISCDNIGLDKGWNTVGFWSGNLMCLGVSMVGNYQKPILSFMHFLGAFLAFGVAVLYTFVQTRITFAFRQDYYKYKVGRGILYLRTFLTVCHVVFFATVVVCGVISYRNRGPDFTSWHKDHEHFDVHLAATLSEWLMFFAFVIYTMTGTSEFKSLEFEEIRFKRKAPTMKIKAEETS